MTASKSNASRSLPRPPRVPAPPPGRRRALRPSEAWYLECLRRWVGFYKRAPSITEFATYTDRTQTPCHRALTALEALGYVEREPKTRRFVPKPEGA